MNTGLKEVKEIAEIITKTFSENKLKAFLFGGTARCFNRKVNSREYLAFPHDLDLLFEVSPEIFQKYAENCYYAGLTQLGYPSDPLSAYWMYHSPAEKRWEIISEIFEINELLIEELVSALDDNKIDPILLPFEWEKDQDILEIINFHDPEFSEKIQRDRLLLFEK